MSGPGLHPDLLLNSIVDRSPPWKSADCHCNAFKRGCIFKETELCFGTIQLSDLEQEGYVERRPHHPQEFGEGKVPV
jgi:hypothetical protein